jgi:hypothetical protein
MQGMKERNIINFLSHVEATGRAGGLLDDVTGAITVISKVPDFIFLASNTAYISPT